jgi:hypothetical protein
MSNFTNTKIKDTYQRVLQIDNGEIQDGLGLPVDARIQSLESDLGFTGDLDGTATLAIGLTSGDKTIQGNLDVIGKITAIEIYAQYESSSIIFSSGSTKFGDTFDDTHQFTGSVLITGSSFLYNGYNIITSNDTGSIVVNSASYAQTASYIQLSGVDGFTSYSSSVSSSISALSSSFISFSASYNTGSFTGSFAGNLQGTSSWATNAISSSHALNADNAISASYALTASYVNPLVQDVIITGSLLVTQSYISTVDYIDFNVTPPTPAFLEGRLHWTDDTKTLQLDTDVNNFELEIGHQSVIRGRNVNSFTLTKGTVVYINGESGNRPTFATASWEGDPSSATTIGIIAQDIVNNQTGYAVTNGLIRNVNTNAFPPGTSLYLSSSGQYTDTPPASPLHEVRLGKTITQATSGILYIDIQNGYELGELHDVLIVSASSGDLVVWSSGSQVWQNTKQLTGSYGITGSLQATSFTGSLLGTSSFATQALSSSFAQTASFAPNYVLTSVTSSMLVPYVLTSQTSSMSVASASVATSASYALTASFALNGGGTINTGSLLTTASVNLNTITFTKGDGSTFPITVDTGSGGGGGAAFPFSGSAIISGSLFVSSSTTNVLTIQGSGSAQPIFTVQGSAGQLFAITDSLSGSLFSVNDISGLPILEVFSDNTILLGDYQAPTLYTTKKVTSIAGNNVIYSLATSSYDGAFFDYVAKSGSNARAGNIMALWSGTSVNFTETTTTDFGDTSGLAFLAFISGSNLVLSGSTSTANWNIKTIIRSI